VGDLKKVLAYSSTENTGRSCFSNRRRRRRRRRYIRKRCVNSCVISKVVRGETVSPVTITFIVDCRMSRI
jgi:hypothetical protein